MVKRGKTENGKQRYLCQQSECPNQTFIIDYSQFPLSLFRPTF
ncbi:MAG: hypothetical protein IPL59_10320 [Candidatus Competibacteraceae bacterium]|nr:hypothetical protein [Candidatus Competibacteraceae bacterium]